MENEAVKNALGLAQRAGKVLCGDFACERAIKSGGACLAALDESASEATWDRYAGLCARANIPCLRIAGLDAAIGRYGRRIAVVTDSGFARMIAGLPAR